MPIPMFNYPLFGVYSNIQPFTVRDGATYLMTLEGLRDWIRDDLVPHLDGEIAKLTASWEENATSIITQFEQISAALIETANSIAGDSAASAAAAEAARLAAEAARDLAQQYASDAVEAQDGAIADLLNSPASATRVKLDTLYVAVATYNALAAVINEGRLSSATLDARFLAKSDKSYVDAQLALRDTIIDAVNDSIDDLEGLTTVGRLGESSLDLRYDRREINPHALFIGSSNSTPGTWVEDFCSQMGYVGHNFSVGGGAFTGSGPGEFAAQVAVAMADSSIDKSLVKYFFICDMGNDIRATPVANLLTGKASSVFATISNNYPNARIILLPAVWGNASLNNIGGRIMSISLRVNEARNAAQEFKRVEIIPDTWTWLADSGSWMKPGEVHPNTAGFARIADFMVKYMQNADVEYGQGFKYVTPKPAINADLSYWSAGRNRDFVTILNNFRLSSAVGIDTELGQLDYGMWPISTVYLPVVASNRTVAGTIVIFESGLIRSLSALPAESYVVNTTYRAF